jgi:selenocysteine lyase/cysteine desulfurase
MEHHSNHTSWLETIADVEVIRPNKEGMVDLDHFAELLDKYQSRQQKIAAITDCSNVTGIRPCISMLARMIHQKGGLCFVDYACSAPYVKIDMHPEDPLEGFDAIYFSPHKFLGGPGAPGVLIFDSKIYENRIPDCPGGGTVLWTNAWGERHYFDDIEVREDGGTPPFLQTIKAALAVKLKEEMGIDNMLRREEEMLQILFPSLKSIPNLHILAGHKEERLAVVSFYIEGLHYNLGVRLLNDLYGIQVRGGCSCAGTYGHYLLDVSFEQSQAITDTIDSGDLSSKPGWMRLSLHPIMKDEEVQILIEAIRDIAMNFRDYSINYHYNPQINEFFYQDQATEEKAIVEKWFTCNFE